MTNERIKEADLEPREEHVPVYEFLKDKAFNIKEIKRARMAKTIYALEHEMETTDMRKRLKLERSVVLDLLMALVNNSTIMKVYFINVSDSYIEYIKKEHEKLVKNRDSQVKSHIVCKSVAFTEDDFDVEVRVFDLENFLEVLGNTHQQLKKPAMVSLEKEIKKIFGRKTIKRSEIKKHVKKSLGSSTVLTEEVATITINYLSGFEPSPSYGFVNLEAAKTLNKYRLKKETSEK